MVGKLLFLFSLWTQFWPAAKQIAFKVVSLSLAAPIRPTSFPRGCKLEWMRGARKIWSTGCCNLLLFSVTHLAFAHMLNEDMEESLAFHLSSLWWRHLPRQSLRYVTLPIVHSLGGRWRRRGSNSVLGVFSLPFLPEWTFIHASGS